VYVVLLVCAWLLPAAIFDEMRDTRPSLLAVPLLLAVFAVPTTALLCVLHAVARKMSPTYFRIAAILILLPGVAIVLSISLTIGGIVLLFSIQVLFGLLVRRPPVKRTL
jgi:hypothetical protein